MAAMPAWAIGAGVSKSGQPAPRPMMSLPSALSLAASAVTARVGEGLTRCARREVVTGTMFLGGTCKSWERSRSRHVAPGHDAILRDSGRADHARMHIE